MEAKKMMAFFLLVLGSVAVLGDARSKCSGSKCFLMADFSGVTDEGIEQYCLIHPEIGAVADNFTGSANDKRNEILAQCFIIGHNWFTGDFPDFEKINQPLRFYRLWDEGLDSCNRSLLESYQAYEYLECLEESCEEA